VFYAFETDNELQYSELPPRQGELTQKFLLRKAIKVSFPLAAL
jgi:hypothetical protein